MPHWTALIEGFLVSIGLLLAIGPQNFYVLRQGLRHRHVFAVTTTTFVSDVLMISLGVMGVGRLFADNPTVAYWLGWGGVAFLVWFALKSLKGAIWPDVMTDDRIEASAGSAAGQGVRIAILHALAFAWLNPWAYVDTMVLIGGVSVKYATDAARLAFLIGAVVASALWFYSIGYGAKKAAPLFKKPVTWRVLDGVITAVMLGVAAVLARHQLSL
ncbi:LysE/ArgO family amino acid transporter [Kordiimonas lacus]|uniref:L-lysine exporter family protein LysE/ArgO n=1 Tax=Kordiimonas lacus TaxID=637679 RepID=A0A1G7AZV2_9PROT|nr:LysE family transporter [Kordiimonas lacus]SDE20222.1 L-lysine exporter family protein LysE/ArgO [Kordiimonas lacus]